jgi:hypothetical protein
METELVLSVSLGRRKTQRGQAAVSAALSTATVKEYLIINGRSESSVAPRLPPLGYLVPRSTVASLDARARSERKNDVRSSTFS